MNAESRRAGSRGGVDLCAFLGRPPQGRKRNPGGECLVEEEEDGKGCPREGNPGKSKVSKA